MERKIMKKLSVIVPVYNAEKTLKKCIDSIIGQTYTDMEIILVDDGSTDGSLGICRQYAGLDDRIKVFHKENAGLVAARKSGAELASGEYVGFVDSDDYIDSDMYSTLMKEANEKGSDIVAGGIKMDYPEETATTYNKIEAGYYDKAAIKEKVIPDMLMKKGFYRYGIIPGVVVKVFKRELIRKSLECVDDSVTLGEDVAITSNAVIRAESISLVKSAGYHYVQTENSMIRGYNPARFEALKKFFCCIEKIDDGAYRRQTGAVYAGILYGILAECVRRKEDGKVNRAVDSMLGDPVTLKALGGAEVSGWSASDRLKVFLMKHKMKRLLTLILRR